MLVLIRSTNAAQCRRAAGLAVALLMLGALGCTPRAPEPQLPGVAPDIAGLITRVTQADGDLRILVEANPADSTGSPKAHIRVTEEVQLCERRIDGVRAAGQAELQEGVRVSVWFSGPVLQSYPVQGGASVIVVERE